MTGSGNFPPGRALRPEVRMNKEQEEAVMKRLTAGEIAELQVVAERVAEHTKGTPSDMVWLKSQQALAILAMASRLVEVESAIVFDVRSTYHRRSIGMSDAEVFAKWLDGVKERGWTSPTQKQGDR